MTRNVLFALMMVLLAPMTNSSAATTHTKKSGRQVTLSLPANGKGEAHTLRLTVVNDAIIRVEATPEEQIPNKRKSLVVVNREGQYTADTEENEQTFTLSTARLTVTVDKRDGQMTFLDRTTGKVLLKEAEGSKTFTRYVSPQTMLPDNYVPSSPDEINWGKKDSVNHLSLDDRSGYSWHLLFESDDNEAFYGLGQHQSEEMNYKGRNEELFQYNTKVAVPFVVSTKNYGILWDSYSYGRWGNPHEYLQLHRLFTLYDKNGRKGTLSGTYTEHTGKIVERNEDSIYYEHAGVVGNLPQHIRLGQSNVVYEGEIEAPETANYHFILYYSGYVRVMMGGREVVAQRWRTAWNPNAFKFEVNLRRGQRTPLRIEWQPDGGVAYCGLRVAPLQTEEEQRRVSIWTEMDKEMDYYFIAGENYDEVIKGYRFLTGKAQVMPRWAMGFWQSREKYNSQKEVEQTLAEFRKRQIPIDNIVQDWLYWEQDKWGSFVFDKKRFPNPKGMVDFIHDNNARLLISHWPKYYVTTDNYKALDAKGWMYQQAIRDSIRDWVGPGYLGSFYDAYSAGARKMFWQQMHDHLFTLGVDAWWMDASEPNVRDCTPMAYRKLLCGPTALGTSDEYFNAYSVVNADAIYTGQRSVDNNKRVFLLTRSGFAGEQRYSTATWSGDIGTRWEDMRAQITAGLNFSMAGIPFWGMDQGGFCVENRYVEAQKIYQKMGYENEDLKEWRELNARWNQFGCFVPLYRTHGQWPCREVWNLAPEGHPCYNTIVWYDRLRYRLMPYLYSMAGWVNYKDYTMMRGLAMDFAADERVLNIADQWMFGPALMACPVTTYKARSRDVYFPQQTGWYDLYSGCHYAGGQKVCVPAPYERMPVFVREGAIIPFGPEQQWSDEKKPELIHLYVYAGADGEFELYEDEGVNYNYERGRSSKILFTWNDDARTLTIGPRRGSFDGMLKRRRFNIVLVTPGTPLNLDHPQGVLVDYQGKQLREKIDTTR
ncbi:MAG: glycoside hydrolase family 31 protein [Prevotella sp.]|nr:glycoside hydrolase family 31 protein [Prevotella sp.]